MIVPVLLAGLPPLIQSNVLFYNISPEEFPLNLKKVLAMICLFILPNMAVTLD